MIFKVVKLVMAFSLLGVYVFGQPQRGNFDPANMPKESKITGKIIDKSASS